MIVRPLKPEDIPILQEMARESGFPYPDLSHSHIESVLVVVDPEGKPIVACAAKRLVELYLYVDSGIPWFAKMKAMSALHREMAKSLRALRYNSCEVFIPPQIADKFGRRLERTWGWVRNWASWTTHF